MNKKNRKGFTIVELVIVIAVIGILTAVLIPTFMGLTDKAHQAENETFVRNINTQLAVNEAAGERNPNMYEAIKDAQEMGFLVDQITPYNGNDIIWDSVNDRFAIVKADFAGTPAVQRKDHVVYADGTFKPETDIHKLWKVYPDMPDSQTYSIYAKKNWQGASEVNNLKVGFDVGENVGFTSINYVNPTGSESVGVRTKGGSLTVNAPSGTLSHYGYVEVLDIQAIDKASYHERGTSGFARLQQGHFVVESEGVVNVLYATGTKSGDTKVVVDNNNGTIGKAYATVDETANILNGSSQEGQSGNVVLEKYDAVVTEDVVTAMNSVSIVEELAKEEASAIKTTLEEVKASSSFRGEGTEAKPYLISDENELMILSQKSQNDNYEGKIFKLERNLDMGSYTWAPIGSADSKPFRGTIDGNNKIVSNLTGVSGGLIHYAGTGLKVTNLILSNVNIAGAVTGGFVDTTTKTVALEAPNVAKITLTNCDINGGSITSTNKLGGLIGECYGTGGSAGILTVDIQDCDITLEKLETSAYRVGGLFGYMSKWTGEIKNCSVNASPTSTTSGKKWVGGFVGGMDAAVSLSVTNFAFTGTAQANLVNAVTKTEARHTVEQCFGITNASGQYLIGCADGMIFYMKDWTKENQPIIVTFNGNSFTFNGHTHHAYFINTDGNLYYESSADAMDHWLGEAGYMQDNDDEVHPAHTTEGTTDPITNTSSADFLKIIFNEN